MVDVEFLAPADVKLKKHRPKLVRNFRVLRFDACAAALRRPVCRRPLKDGFYDHSQDSVESILLKFGPSASTKNQTRPKDEPDWLIHIPMGVNSWTY